MQASQAARRKAFKDKIAFISGGSRGIGLAIAEKLASLGAHIVFTYLRSRSDAGAAERRLKSHSVRVLSLRVNMGNREQLEKIFRTVREKFGRLDFMIHNAATGDLKPVMDLTIEDMDRSFDINFKSLFLCSQLATPLMHGRNGKIVSISSHGSNRVLPNYAAVGSAKAAIEALSRYLAVELAAKGISVNSVIAGTTDTQSLRKIPRHEEMLHSAKARTPAGRIGHPEDIANVVAFLCSEESRWIVGQTIVADGGFSLLA